MRRTHALGLLALIVACGGGTPASGDTGTTTGADTTSSVASTNTAMPTTDPSSTAQTSAAEITGADSSTDSGATSTGGTTDPPSDILEVRFLGVGGFSIRHDEDLVLTAPMYSNPGVLEVQFGTIEANPARIEAFLDPTFVEGAAAILSGHAHYDHLLDVPYVWGMTDHALVLGNSSVAKLMAAAGLPDEAFVSLDDPELAWVDTRNCAEPNACTGLAAGNEGAWLELPQSNARVRAFCSSHPAQVLGTFHFGEGCVDGDPKMVPTAADEWKEGATLSYLIDFLDPESGEIVFRVFAQDAPTDAPIGHPPIELLDEKRVDLALVNVGSWENVGNHPGEIIATLEPRYLVGGHWEDFFRPQDEPIMPLPFSAPPEDFDAAAIAAMGDEAEADVVVDGVAQSERYFRVVPGTDFEFPIAR